MSAAEVAAIMRLALQAASLAKQVVDKHGHLFTQEEAAQMRSETRGLRDWATGWLDQQAETADSGAGG